MELYDLSKFNGGWFIGKFDPSICGTDYFEAALKTYKAGDVDKAHYHNIAVEYTLVVTGEVDMNGVKYFENDIIVVHPKEVVKFSSITDSKLMVIKMPSVKGDKYIVE
jgi:hypothetical protein